MITNEKESVTEKDGKNCEKTEEYVNTKIQEIFPGISTFDEYMKVIEFFRLSLPCIICLPYKIN